MCLYLEGNNYIWQELYVYFSSPFTAVDDLNYVGSGSDGFTYISTMFVLTDLIFFGLRGFGKC